MKFFPQSKLPGSLAIILFSLTIAANGLELKIFKDLNFRGLIYEDETTDPGCQNIKPYAQGVAGSVKLDRCIISFESVNCQGKSRKLEPATGNLAELMKPIYSYFLCNETHGGEKIRVDFTDDRDNILAEYKNICGCQDLPSQVSSNAAKLLNYGNCVKIFQTDSCDGASKEIPGGKSDDSENLRSFGYYVRSIRACGTCGKLKSEIYKFVLNFEDESALEGYEKKVELAAKTTFYNNGSATVTQQYEASRTVRQSYTVTLSQTITQMDSFTVGAGVSANVGVGKGPFSASIGASVSGSLTAAYTETESNEHSWTKEEEKTFTVTQTIEIPPCVEYEVSSMVSIAENVPIEYELYTRVTGEASGRRMTTLEVQSLVYNMTYVGDADEFTALYSSKHNLVASVGVDTFISGEGLPIKGCVSDNSKIEL